MNVPRGERIASVAVGGALAAVAVNSRSWLLGALGVALIARGTTGRCPVYRMRATRKGISVHRSITIQCAPMEVYELWRDFDNLPRFMEHGELIARDVEIVEDTPGRRLRWRSLPGAALAHEGTLDVSEAPGGRGTVVEVRLVYRTPGAFALRILPQVELAEDLARLRMLLETGEVATGARQPSFREQLVSEVAP